MTSQKVLVIGATGNQGTGVVQSCLGAGHVPSALVRDVSSPSSKKLLEACPGLPLHQGALDDVDALTRAMAGSDAVFFIVPVAGLATEKKYTANIISAARASGSVSHLIYSGAALTGRHESFPGFGPDHGMYEYWLSKHSNETMLREATGGGLKHWTIVRPAVFLTNFLPPLSAFYFPGPQDANKSILRTAFRPDLKIPFIVPADVGKVVAKALSEPNTYSAREVDLATEALTCSELANKMQSATGKNVVAKHESVEAMEAVVDPRVVASQKLFNEVDLGIDVEQRRQEFGLTTVEDFFKTSRV